MKNRLPSKMPTIAQMVDDLGMRPDEVATLLDVSRSTVYRWLAVGHAPRSAQLSLFWLTRWGASVLDAELVNRHNIQAGLANALRRELQTMRERIEVSRPPRQAALRRCGRLFPEASNTGRFDAMSKPWLEA